MFSRLTILQRLALVFVLGTVLGAITISYFFYYTSIRSLQSELQANLQETWYKNFSDAIHTTENLGQQSLAMLMDNPHLVEAVEQNDPVMVKRVLLHFKEVMRVPGIIKNLQLSIIDSDGHLIASTLSRTQQITGSLLAKAKRYPNSIVSEFSVKDGHIRYLMAINHHYLEMDLGLSVLIQKLYSAYSADLLFYPLGSEMPVKLKANKPEILQELKQAAFKPSNGEQSRFVPLNEQYVAIEYPLKSGDELIGHAMVVLPAEKDYFGILKEQTHVVIMDILVVVLIDILVNLVVLFTIYRDAVKPIRYVMTQMNYIAEGDLSHSTDVESGGRDMRAFLRQFEQMRLRWGDIVQAIRKNSIDLAARSNESYENVTTMCKVLKNEEAQVAIIAGNASEMHKLAINVSDQSRESSEDMETVASDVNRGVKGINSVEGMIQTLSKDIETSSKAVELLGEEVTHIAEVLDTINNIAEQTNLLSLNAAIEAARAGEHGRGFAVVADEVRQLAMNTQQTLDEVTKLAESIRQRASYAQSDMAKISNIAVNSSAEAHKQIAEFNKVVEDINDTVEDLKGIGPLTEKQKQEVAGVTQEIEEVRIQTEDIVKRASETLKCFEIVKREANQLSEMVKQFKV